MENLYPEIRNSKEETEVIPVHYDEILPSNISNDSNTRGQMICNTFTSAIDYIKPNEKVLDGIMNSSGSLTEKTNCVNAYESNHSKEARKNIATVGAVGLIACVTLLKLQDEGFI